MSAWCLWVWGGGSVELCRVHGAVRNTDFLTYLTYLTGKATEEEIVSYVHLRPHRLNAQASKWVRKSAWCGQFAASVTSSAPSVTFLFSSHLLTSHVVVLTHRPATFKNTMTAPSTYRRSAGGFSRR